MLPFRQMLFATVLLAAVVFDAAAEGREEYVQVQAKDLVKKPHMYWAQGIVFKDVIAEVPVGEARKLGERVVVPFKVDVAGECFAETALVEPLRRAGAGAECIFTASVFQETFWFKKSRFRIIIHEVIFVSARTTDIRAGISNLTAAGASGPYGAVGQRLDSILSQVQSELAAFSAESSTPMSELLNPAGPHRDRVLNAMRSGIARIEEEIRAPASVYLSDLLIAILASQHMPAPTPAPSTNVVPEVEVPDSTKAAVTDPVAPAAVAPTVVTSNAPPAKKSFFSRIFGGGESKAKPVQKDKSAPVQPKTEKIAPTDQSPMKDVPAAKPLAGNVTPKKSFWASLFGGGEKKKQSVPAKASDLKTAPSAVRAADSDTIPAH